MVVCFVVFILSALHALRDFKAGAIVIRGVCTILLSILFGAVCSYASAGADSSGFLLSKSTQSELNLVLETVKFLAALGLTLILLVIVLALIRKIMRTRGAQGVDGAAVQVLKIQHIDPKKAIALVRVLDRVLIVGCAEHSLTNLGELSPDDIGRLNVTKHSESGVFKAILSRFTGSDAIKSAE